MGLVAEDDGLSRWRLRWGLGWWSLRGCGQRGFNQSFEQSFAEDIRRRKRRHRRRRTFILASAARRGGHFRGKR
jgi:hypothetical protein